MTREELQKLAMGSATATLNDIPVEEVLGSSTMRNALKTHALTAIAQRIADGHALDVALKEEAQYGGSILAEPRLAQAQKDQMSEGFKTEIEKKIADAKERNPEEPYEALHAIKDMVTSGTKGVTASRQLEAMDVDSWRGMLVRDESEPGWQHQIAGLATRDLRDALDARDEQRLKEIHNRIANMPEENLSVWGKLEKAALQAVAEPIEEQGISLDSGRAWTGRGNGAQGQTGGQVRK